MTSRITSQNRRGHGLWIERLEDRRLLAGDWQNKRGPIPAQLAPILERLGLDADKLV